MKGPTYTLQIVELLVSKEHPFYRELKPGIRISAWVNDFNDSTSVHVLTKIEESIEVKILSPQILFGRSANSDKCFYLGFGDIAVYKCQLIKTEE